MQGQRHYPILIVRPRLSGVCTWNHLPISTRSQAIRVWIFHDQWPWKMDQRSIQGQRQYLCWIGRNRLGGVCTWNHLPISTRSHAIRVWIFDDQWPWKVDQRSIQGQRYYIRWIDRRRLSGVCTWNHLPISTRSHAIRLWIFDDLDYLEMWFGL